MTTCIAVLILLANFVTAFSQQVDVWTTNALSQNPRDRLRLTKRLLFHDDKTSGEYVVDVNEQTVYQSVDGFGITLSDSSAWLMWNKMTSIRRELVLKTVFDRKMGIGLNVVRVSIGASEFSRTNYTYDDTCCDLSDFTIEHDREYIIPILKTIKKWNPDLIIMGVLWSPPAWMKVNNSTVGGKLRRDEYSNFATYITKFVQAYQKEGLPIHSVVIQNEPLRKSCCYPSMSMDAREQAHIIKTKLGPVFRKYKLSTTINIYGQEWAKVEYPLDVLEDEEVKDYVGGIAFTCYGGTAQLQSQVYKIHPEQDIWLVECTDRLQNHFAPSFKYSISGDLVKPFRNYARGVIKGNLILNQGGGPRNEGCKDCLGLITLDESSGNVTYNSAYYSFGHVSKFVRGGARRIQSSTFSNHLDSLAFLNQDGSKVLTVNNRGDMSKVFKVQWGNVSFLYSLEPSSAATFTWKGRQSRRSAFERIEAESYSTEEGTELKACSDTSGCGDAVVNIDSGDYLKYENVDFGEDGISSIAIRYASKSTKTGLLEIRLDALDGKFMGLLQLKPTGDWQNWTTVTDRVRAVTGVRDLYLVFRGGDPAVGNVNWFIFNRPPNAIPSNVAVNENALYKIVEMNTGKVLGLSNVQRTKILQLQNFVNSDNQTFIFRSVGNGCYKIGLKNDLGLVIGYYELNGKADNAQVTEVPDRNGLNQIWRLDKANDSYLHIMSCTNSKVWSVDHETVQNSEVHLRSFSSDIAQKFSVVSTALYSKPQAVSENYWRKD